MLKVRLPLSLFPYSFLVRTSNLFLGIADKIAKRKKSLSSELEQAEIAVEPKKYVALCISSSFFTFVVLSIFFAIIMKIAYQNPIYGLAVSFVLSAIIYNRQLAYPKLLIIKRVRETEQNLLPALRTLLIQMNSGVTLFDAMKSVAQGKYGYVSVEFGRIIKRVEAGESAIEALERVARTNPSTYFRRVLWQLMIAIKAGSNIAVVVQSIINSLSAEQLTKVQAYSARLSPLSMLYMVITVILPALAIAFLTVLSLFVSGLQKMIKPVLIAITFLVIFLQIAFMGMIKTGRPSIG